MADLLLELNVLVVVGPVLYARKLDLLGADKHTNGFMVCQTAMQTAATILAEGLSELLAC